MVFPLLAAALPAVASVVGGVIQGKASSKATKAQLEAQQRALEQQTRMYEQARTDLNPFMQGGVSGLNAYMEQLGLAPLNSGAQGQPPAPQYDEMGQPIAPREASAGGTPMAAGKANPNDPTAPAPPVRQPDPAGASYKRPEIAPLPTYQPSATGQPPTAPSVAPRPGMVAPTYALSGQGGLSGQGASASTVGLGVNPTISTGAASVAAAGNRPNVQAFTFQEPDLSGEAFQNSPGYQYRVDQAAKGTLAKYAAIGGLQSGAAQKALSKNIGDEADQDFTDWRNFTASNALANNQLRYEGWNATTGYGQAGYTSDADRASRDQISANTLSTQASIAGAEIGSRERISGAELGSRERLAAADLASGDWRYLTSAQQGAYEDDRNFGYSAYRDQVGDAADARDFGYGAYRDQVGDAIDTRNFTQGAFEGDRAFDYGSGQDTLNRLDSRYATDYGVYQDQRDTGYARTDRRTDDLYRLTGLGANAASASASAAQRFGDASAASLTAQGDARASGALTQGNIWSGVTGDLAGSLSSYLKGIGGTGGSGIGAGGSVYNPYYRGMGPSGG